MNAIGLTLASLFVANLNLPLTAVQIDSSDRRVEQPRGYHIISRPARTGETPPDVKREKAEENNDRYRRAEADITDQTPPTRQPELKPKAIKP